MTAVPTPAAPTQAVFVPADPPRSGWVALWGAAPPVGEGPEELLPLVLAPGHRVRPVPVRRVSVAEALPLLLAVADTAQTGDGLRFWAAAARLAVGLVARGRLLPGVSPAGVDAWRAGPLDPVDSAAVQALAAAMPAVARARPLPSPDPAPEEAAPGELLLPAAAPLLRAFLDAVADVLPRSPAPRSPTLRPDEPSGPFSTMEAFPAEHLREWAADAAAGVDAGVRVSLRLELGAATAGGRADHPGAVRLVVQVHPLADPVRMADLAEIWSGRAVGFGPDARVDALRAIRRAARFWAPLEQLLSSPVPDVAELDDAEVTDLLDTGAAALAAAGVAVHRPRELREGLETRAVVGGASGSTGAGLGEEPFALDWELALRGSALTPAERAALSAAHGPVVRLRDGWVLLDSATRARVAEATPRRIAPLVALGAALTGEVEIDGTRVELRSTGVLEQLRAALTEPPTPVPAPDALAATLRDYQLRGLGWLERMTRLGLGACLADDMGLGKTITLIALHLSRAGLGQGPTLVVCPASLLGNWEREITRFAPGVPVHRHHGPARAAVLPGAGFVLTTYATMRLDADLLAGHRWGLLVADEAQHVKNAASGTARALRTIPSAARVALTGTPVENDLDELWSILDWATPGLLGPRAVFRRRWAEPIAAGDEPTAARFARLLGPFLLRRRKSDPGVAPELPPKTETDRPVGLTPEQAGLYSAVVAETLGKIAAAEGMERRGLVLALLTALKQIGNHPAQYLREADPVLVGRSGKLELLDELLDTILAEDGSVLVFTQYVTMARLLARHLGERGIGHALLHGGTPVPRREELVAAFQRGEVPVFLLSLRAAGTGLNLTRADHVVHYDRWWNPAVEDQATDRAHRIGQTRPVQVHRLVAEGTVEDRIAALLDTKRALADSVLAGGEASLSELGDDELADLVGLRPGGPV